MPNQLKFSANIAPPSAPIEVSYNGGASFTPLAFATVGSLQEATLTNVPAATYAAGQLIMRAVGYPATAVSNPSARTVLAASTGPYTLTPALADYSQTAGIDELQSDGRRRHACFAVLEANTTASTVGVSVLTTGSSRTFSAYLEGTLLNSYQVALGTTTTTIALPGSGVRRLKLVEGSADQDQPGQPIIGTTIQALTFPAGSAANFVVSTFSEMLIGFGDSIMSGAVATYREVSGWLPRMRASGRGIIAISHGSRTAKLAFGDSAARTISLAQLDAGWSGITTKKSWIGLMVNDCLKQVWTPTQYAAGIAAFLDQAHINHPTAIFYLQTAIPFAQGAGEAQAYGGFTVQNFRDALAALVPPRSAYCILVDGTQLVSSSQLPDGLHPNEQGHSDWAIRAEAILTGTSSVWQNTSPPNEFVTLSGNSLAKTGGVDNWDGFGLGKYRVNVLTSGTGEYARLRIPNPDSTRAGTVTGFAVSPTPTAAGTDRRQAIVLGVYSDGGGVAVWRDGAAQVGGGYIVPVGGGMDNYDIVAFADRLEFQHNNVTLSTIPGPPPVLYVHGVLYYTSPTGDHSRISGATLTGSTLATF